MTLLPPLLLALVLASAGTGSASVGADRRSLLQAAPAPAPEREPTAFALSYGGYMNAFRSDDTASGSKQGLGLALGSVGSCVWRIGAASAHVNCQPTPLSPASRLRIPRRPRPAGVVLLTEPGTRLPDGDGVRLLIGFPNANSGAGRGRLRTRTPALGCDLQRSLNATLPAGSLPQWPTSTPPTAPQGTSQCSWTTPLSPASETTPPAPWA